MQTHQCHQQVKVVMYHQQIVYQRASLDLKDGFPLRTALPVYLLKKTLGD